MARASAPVDARALRRRAIVLAVGSAVLFVTALFVLDPFLYGDARTFRALRFVALAASALAMVVALVLFVRADRAERR